MRIIFYCIKASDLLPGADIDWDNSTGGLYITSEILRIYFK